jgi:hypothetical protein
MSSRYESYGRMDTQFQTDGDFHFRGLDMKHDRSTLASGILAKSINKRLRTGIAETRPGTRIFEDFINKIVGSTVYNNPNGREQLIVAEATLGKVWALEDGQPFREIWLCPNDVIATTDVVWFVQAFDKLLLLRPGKVPRVWDGVDYGEDGFGGFAPIVKSDPADTSTVIIPNNVGYAINFQSRVLYLQGKDTILMSDVLDYTSYDPVLSVFRINAGESDQIVSMHPYGKESIVIFKRNSIHQLSNFTTTTPFTSNSDSALGTQTVLSDELGAVGREAAVQVGSDIIFLSRSGFYRLSQVLDTKTSTAPIPISDKISPLLTGIDWEHVSYIGFAGLAILGDYMYALVPIGNTFPKNVLVYNTATSEWESVDAWEDTLFFINEFRTTIFNGERRLFGINASQGYVNLLYEGVTDQTRNAVTFPVNDIIETRGYMERDDKGNSVGGDTWKNFKKTNITMRLRNSLVTVSALMDGYNEVKNLTPIPISKPPAQYYTFAHPPFSPALIESPYRKSYYTGSETEWVAQDMSNLLPGRIDLLPGVQSEMLGGPKTESMERLSVRTFGRWCSIRISNTRDQCDIVGCSVDLQEARRHTHTLA